MRDGIAEAYRLNEMEWVSYLKFQLRMERGLFLYSSSGCYS